MGEAGIDFLPELEVKLREGCRKAVEVSLDAIDQARGRGDASFVSVDADRALATADAIDRLRSAGVPLGPLAGSTLGIKDLFDVAGEVTRAGGSVDLGPPARADGAAVARLRGAGMVALGRTNMTEFAFSGLGLNPHYGTPLSPWRAEEQRIAGGSTSGGASAVAHGLIDVALGSDTGGSCRIPAAFCGLVGFKPTARRVSKQGMVPLSATLDTVGWIARDIEKVIALDNVLTDGSGGARLCDVGGFSLGIPAQIVMDDIAPEVAAIFDVAVASLERAGVRISRISIPELEEIAQLNALGGFAASESYAWHRGRLAAFAESYDPRVLSRIQRGAAQSAADYVDLLKGRAKLVTDVERRVARVDFLLFPTVPILPPRLSELKDDGEFARINLLALRNSTIVNMIDGCAINLPASRSLPVGVTIAGIGGSDADLLGAALACSPILQEG